MCVCVGVGVGPLSFFDGHKKIVEVVSNMAGMLFIFKRDLKNVYF